MSNDINIQLDENHVLKAKIAKADWALLLMNRGVIVKPVIHYWQGSAKIKPEDLGLCFASKEGKFVCNEYMTLGTKKLLPTSIIKECKYIINKSLRCLEKHTYDTMWGNFMPYKAFPAWEKENQECQDLFNKFVINFMNKYDNIVALISDEYRKLATEAWQRQYPGAKDVSESFVIDYIDSNIKLIPPIEKMRSFFKYEFSFSAIPLPAILQENINKAIEKEEEARLSSEAKIQAARIEAYAKQRIADMYISKKEDFVNNFLDVTINTINRKIIDICNHILKTLSKEENSDINESHLKKIRELIKSFKLLDISNDEELENKLIQLGNEAEKVKGIRDPKVLAFKIQEVMDSVQKSPYFEDKSNIDISATDDISV